MKKLWKMRNSQGFTIVELVVVIAVIGILATVTIPSFTSSKQYVDEQEERLYQELSKLDVPPHGTLLGQEISAEKVEIDSVTITNTEVQVGTVTVIPSEVVVKVNSSVTNDPKYDPYKELIWTSSDPSIANVSNGSVAGYLEGTVTITATSVVDQSKFATCTVTVTPSLAVATGGSMSFVCKYDANSDRKCDITGEELPDGSHVHTVMSDVTSNYCFLKQCADAQAANANYFTYTENLNSTHIPTVTMDTDYIGDLSVDFYGVDKDGENQRIAMILDLNGKTIIGGVNINGIANITSSNGKGKILNTSSDTSDGIFISGSQSGDPLYTGKVENVHIEAKRYGIYVGNGAQTKNNGGVSDSDIIAEKVGVYVGKKIAVDSNYRYIYGCNISAPIGVEFHGNSAETIEKCKIFATDIGIYIGSGANDNASPRIKKSFIYATNYGIKSETNKSIKLGVGNFVWAENNEALHVGSNAEISSKYEDGSFTSIYYSVNKNGVHFTSTRSDIYGGSMYYNVNASPDTVSTTFGGVTDATVTSGKSVNDVKYYTPNIDKSAHTFNVNETTKNLTNLKLLVSPATS